MSAARSRGVKIIQYHGWNDQTLQPAYSPQYYERVMAANGGAAKTQEFYRLFMVPAWLTATRVRARTASAALASSCRRSATHS